MAQPILNPQSPLGLQSVRIGAILRGFAGFSGVSRGLGVPRGAGRRWSWVRLRSFCKHLLLRWTHSDYRQCSMHTRGYRARKSKIFRRKKFILRARPQSSNAAGKASLSPHPAGRKFGQHQVDHPQSSRPTPEPSSILTASSRFWRQPCASRLACSSAECSGADVNLPAQNVGHVAACSRKNRLDLLSGIALRKERICEDSLFV